MSGDQIDSDDTTEAEDEQELTQSVRRFAEAEGSSIVGETRLGLVSRSPEAILGLPEPEIPDFLSGDVAGGRSAKVIGELGPGIEEEITLVLADPGLDGRQPLELSGET